MEVIKEAYLIQDSAGMFMCAQNTATPKLYASEASARSAVNYYLTKDAIQGHHTGYKVKKAFIVITGVEDDSQQEMF